MFEVKFPDFGVSFVFLIFGLNQNSIIKHSTASFTLYKEL